MYNNKKIFRKLLYIIYKLYYPIRRILEHKYNKKLRKKLNNKNITIISNNCIGGVIYHNLGLRFDSPTINTLIKGEDYLVFCAHLKDYLNAELIKHHDKQCNYPVGILKAKRHSLPSVRIDFVHYKTFKEAKEKWEQRKTRINFNNIFYIWEFYDELYDNKIIEKLDELEINKMILLHRNLPQIKNKFIFSFYKNEKDTGKSIEFKKWSGKRHLEEWDYVEWFNNKKYYKLER